MWRWNCSGEQRHTEPGAVAVGGGIYNFPDSQFTRPPPLLSWVVRSQISKGFAMEILGMILVVVGFIVSVVGGIWFLVVAFQESVFWGLGCLLLPFVTLIFLIQHWDKAGRPFLIQLAGVVPFIVGQIMMSPQG